MINAERLVSTTEYARLHGIQPINVRKMLLRGGLKTAVRLGKNWYIDKDEPWPDRRVKSGKYVGWREKHPVADEGTKEEER